MEFRYVAVDARGQTVSGLVSAGGEREATRMLLAQELTPLEIGPVTAPRPGRARRATEAEKALVIRELATLLGAGVPLAEAVQSIGQSHADSAIGAAFLVADAKLRGGETLSAGLAAGAVDWPEHLFQLVQAGEHTGKLADALESAAGQMEYEQRVRSEMRSALIYPSILVVSGIAAVLLIFVVVVPKFAGILRSSRAQVPDISRWVLTAGVFVKDNLGWIALGAAVLAVVAWRALADPARRGRMVEAISRAPLVGAWLVETETGRWAAMLATLLHNRVPILKAMELSQSGLRLASLRRKLEVASREVRAGRKLGEALAGVQMLDVTGLNLVRVGERSGELATMLRALARLHEDAARDRMKRALILIEPAAILAIGGIIAFIMVSVMLAITSLTNIRF